MNWLYDLVKWYVRQCDRQEGHVVRVLNLWPRGFGVKGWKGKVIQIVVQTVDESEIKDDLWQMKPSKIPR